MAADAGTRACLHSPCPEGGDGVDDGGESVMAVWSLLRETASRWSDHKASLLGAAIAYYSVFSLGPLMVIAIAIAGFVFGDDAARGEVSLELKSLLGETGAQAVQAMLALLWVSKSPDKLAAALTEMGHPISADTVDKELVGIGYTRQFNRKTNEGSKNPDRNAQFEYINAKVAEAQRQHQPVISVDTKKKELIGNYKNGETDYRPKGDPCRVNAHDFENKTLGKVAPYGVYDMTANTGFVSVGITSDTAEFAVQSIRCWRERMGLMRYPGAQELTVTADCGGSNGARVRLWKRELQTFPDENGIAIHVHHYPPGTSKWNKIEHRLFCHITQTWRARPLTSRIAVVESIAATTTKTGLKVESALDTRHYQKGLKVSKAEMKSLNIKGHDFHPEWNYTVRPRQSTKT